MGDFNKYKNVNVRMLTQMGMTKVNHHDTYVAALRNRATYHFNDQIFVYRLDAEMVHQIRYRDANADV